LPIPAIGESQKLSCKYNAGHSDKSGWFRDKPEQGEMPEIK